MRPAPLAILGVWLALAGPAPGQESPRTIRTTGEATVHVVPDEVGVTFGVETFHADLDKAKLANDKAGGRLLRAFATSGIEPKLIRTDNLRIDITYQGTPRTVEGYTARRAYSVTLKDAGRLEALVDSALKNGANQLLGFDFRTTKLRQHRDEARRLAIRAAKEKAVALARELDCAVGKPRTITEDHAGTFYFGSYYLGAWYGYGQGGMSQVSAQAQGGGPEGETIPLGQISVRAQVSVTFDLADK
jgi:uncharacterized protein